MVILIRSNDASPDPRLQKYINYLDSVGEKYTVLAWNRAGTFIEKENYIYFNKKAEFGLGIRNIPKKLMWFLFILKQLIKYKNRYKTIHACDLDTAIPSYMVKILLNKKMVFDVFDWMSVNNSNTLLGRLLSKTENYVFKNSDYTIICEKHRLSQVHETARRESYVLPNIPDIEFTVEQNLTDKLCIQHENYKTVLTYVGVFDLNRGLEEILEVVSQNKDICLNIAGFGFLNEKVKTYANKFENIIYWGKVDYNKGLNLLKNADLIVAFYYLTNPVHKYAAPNKYYESLFLGKPLITNDGTLVSKNVLENNTGFVINEGSKALFEFLTKPLNLKEINKKSESCKKIWLEVYSDYTSNFMKESYCKMLNINNDIFEIPTNKSNEE